MTYLHRSLATFFCCVFAALSGCGDDKATEQRAIRAENVNATGASMIRRHEISIRC